MKIIPIFLLVFLFVSGNLIGQQFLKFERSWPVQKTSINAQKYKDIAGDGEKIYLLRNHGNVIDVLSNDGYRIDGFHVDTNVDDHCQVDHISVDEYKIYAIANCRGGGGTSSQVFEMDKRGRNLTQLFSMNNYLHGSINHDQEIYSWQKEVLENEDSVDIHFYKNGDNLHTHRIRNYQASIFNVAGIYVAFCAEEDYKYSVISTPDSHTHSIIKISTNGEQPLTWSDYSLPHETNNALLDLSKKDGPVSCGIIGNKMLMTSAYNYKLLSEDISSKPQYETIEAGSLDDLIYTGRYYLDNKILSSYYDSSSENTYNLHYGDGIEVLDGNLDKKLSIYNSSDNQGYFNNIKEVKISNNQIHVRDGNSENQRIQTFDLNGGFISETRGANEKSLTSSDSYYFGYIGNDVTVPVNHPNNSTTNSYFGATFGQFSQYGRLKYHSNDNYIIMQEYLSPDTGVNCEQQDKNPIDWDIPQYWDFGIYLGTQEHSLHLYTFDNESYRTARSIITNDHLIQCNTSNLIHHWTRSSESEIAVLRPYGLISRLDNNGNNLYTFSPAEIIHDNGNNRYEVLDISLSNVFALDGENNYYIPNPYNFRGEGSNYVRFPGVNNFRKFTYDPASDIGSMSTIVNNTGSMLDPINDMKFHDGKLFIASSNKISIFKVTDTPSKSRAIIIAGDSSEGEEEILWSEIQSNANHAYVSLANQGYTKDNIQYLNSNDFDFDGNGELDDMDGNPTLDNIKKAITEWAPANGVTEDLVIYMIGHGGNRTFSLIDNDLQANELNQWLNELQENYPSIKVTVVIDACKSGSFQEPLETNDGNRYVISSSKSNQDAYFTGSISFSHLFWDSVFSGKMISDAFKIAHDTIKLSSDEKQIPQLNTDGNAIYNSEEDYNGAASHVIGSGTVVNIGEPPSINDIQDTGVAEGESSSTFRVETTDDSGIQKVWAIVRPPHFEYTEYGGSPIQNLPQFTFSLSDTIDTYEGSYDGFNQHGDYQIAIYVKDKDGNISLSTHEISVVNPSGRKAIIVAGLDSAGQFDGYIQNNAEHAYDALLKQGYVHESIAYLSANKDFIAPGVDAFLTKASLENMIKTAKVNASDLVIYLIGDTTQHGLFPLSVNDSSEIDYLAMNQLNSWLNAIQGEDGIQGTVTVIQEGSRSGHLTKSIDTNVDHSRIVISSTSEENGSIRIGRVSFSWYFWDWISRGASVDRGFHEASAFMETLWQTAEINANGNQTSNDKFETEPYWLGLGILIGSNEPKIGQVVPNTVLQNGQVNSNLWAENVSASSEIAQVWAVIEPPKYNPINYQTGKLSIVQLTDNNEDGRWEATHESFDRVGEYKIHYYAMDDNNYLSAPVTSTVTQTIGPDPYEEDNALTTASFLSDNTNFRQWHNFHKAEDVDFIKFHADPSNGMYTLKVDSSGSQADTVFSLYDSCLADAEPIGLLADGSFEVDKVAGNRYEIAYWTPPVAGYYCLKVRPYDSNSAYGDRDNGYIASIFPSNAPQSAVIQGIVTNGAGDSIQGARVFSSTNHSATTDENGNYSFQLKPGRFKLYAEAVGYECFIMELKDVAPEDSLTKNIQLTSNPSNLDGLSCPKNHIYPRKLPKTEFEFGHQGPMVMQVLDVDVPDDGAELRQITISSSGTGNEASDIKSVKLYHDTNQNDVLDSSDVQIGNEQQFTQDNGSITFDLEHNPYNFAAGNQRVLVVFEKR